MKVYTYKNSKSLYIPTQKGYYAKSKPQEKWERIGENVNWLKEKFWDEEYFCLGEMDELPFFIDKSVFDGLIL